MSASDYSGSHSRSRYWVYSCLYASEADSLNWPEQRRLWRQQCLPDGRRLSYKTLNDGMRARALGPFLDNAELLSGALITIAVDKDMNWLTTSPATVATLSRLGALSGRWGPAAFELMSRITLLWSLGLAALCQPNQHVTWITDEDDIAANDDRHTDLLNWAAKFCGLFINCPMQQLDVSTTAADNGARGLEDFVAIPDLCAGMLGELVNSSHMSGGADNSNCIDLASVKPKAGLLSDWYFTSSESLRRIAIVIKRNERGEGVVSRWTTI